MTPYDVAVIGAGINGCAAARELTRTGLRVALIDRSGIAKGGSGAAGAFISPKVSKGGPLKEIMDTAYRFSLEYYNAHFPDCITNTRQLHLAKFEDENAKVAYFREHTSMPLAPEDPAVTALLTDASRHCESVFLAESGIVDAERVCRHMAEGIDFYPVEAADPVRREGVWEVAGVAAHTILLATGAYDKVLEEPYIALRGIWGHRIDIRTSTSIGAIIHHKVSLAPTDASGQSAIGATHNVHFHPQHTDTPYDVEAGRAELLEKALSTVLLKDVEILRDYTGLRSGSNDYLPMLGPLVDAAATLERHPGIRNGERIDPADYCYHPDCHMINGSGGYGFVLAPLLATQFACHITKGDALDKRLLPSRFFTRLVKRAGPDRA